MTQTIVVYHDLWKMGVTVQMQNCLQPFDPCEAFMELLLKIVTGLILTVIV